MTNKSAKFENKFVFCPLLKTALNDSYPKCTVLKVDLLQDHQIYCLEACVSVCTFQPANLTGCDSEGVNVLAHQYDTGHDNGDSSNGNEDDDTDASALDTANDANSTATFVSLVVRPNSEKYWQAGTEITRGWADTPPEWLLY